MPPNRRLQPAEELQRVLLRPVASPVNTFRQTDAGQQLAQLAQGLGQFSTKLARYADGAQERQNKEDYEAGQARAAEIQQQAKDYKSAIDQGLIPRAASPFFHAGVRENYGRVSANQRDQDIRATLAADPEVQQATTLEAFDKAYQKAASAWDAKHLPDGKRDRHFNTGFASRAQALQESARNQALGTISKNLEDMSITTVYADTKAHVREVVGRMSPEQVVDELHYLMTASESVGMDIDQVERTVFKALGDAALEEPGGSRKIAALLPLLMSSKGGRVVDAQGGKNAEYARSISLQVARLGNEQAVREHQERAMAKEQRRDTAEGEAMRRLLADPTANTRDLEQSVSDDPAAVRALRQARDIAAESGQYDDPSIKDELFTGVWTGSTGVREILSMYRHTRGRGLTLTTANALIGEVNQRQAMERSIRADQRQTAAIARQDQREERQLAMEHRREYRDIVTDPLFVREASNIRQQFTENGIFTAAAGTTSAIVEAHLTKAWVTWQATPEGKNADPAARVEWLARNSAALVKVARGTSAVGQILERHLDRQDALAPASIPVPVPQGPAAAQSTTAPSNSTRPKLVLTQEDLTARDAGRLTPNALNHLRALGIATDPQAIANFYSAQAREARRQRAAGVSRTRRLAGETEGAHTAGQESQ